ncbi:MAG: GGDEF domain-containing protein [Candidatus Nanopelagicales bacterium]|jgi:GGDEF domain-containing protein|nr:GGDEF domain-containing protein [Candidatus Nanopelagicales bacterium]
MAQRTRDGVRVVTAPGQVLVDQGPQFRLLAVLQVGAGLVTFAFGVLQLNLESQHEVEIVLGLLWLVLAAITWVLAPRRNWGIDVSLAGSAILLGAAGVVTVDASVAVFNGLGMILLGVFAAHALPLARVLVFLAISAGAFVSGVAVSGVIQAGWIAAGVVAMLVFSTLHVWFLVDRLREASLTDPLTGALNRHGLAVRAPAVHAVAQRAGEPTVVGLIDLDAFKEVNDLRGHAAGDALLVELVRGWSAGLRSGDQLARVGGDEFVLVLPDCDELAAESLLGRLRALSPCDWTAGIVRWEAGQDVFDAVRAADAAMYRRKHAGPGEAGGHAGGS